MLLYIYYIRIIALLIIAVPLSIAIGIRSSNPSVAIITSVGVGAITAVTDVLFYWLYRSLLSH